MSAAQFDGDAAAAEGVASKELLAATGVECAE